MSQNCYEHTLKGTCNSTGDKNNDCQWLSMKQEKGLSNVPLSNNTGREDYIKNQGMCYNKNDLTKSGGDKLGNYSNIRNMGIIGDICKQNIDKTVCKPKEKAPDDTATSVCSQIQARKAKLAEILSNNQVALARVQAEVEKDKGFFDHLGEGVADFARNVSSGAIFSNTITSLKAENTISSDSQYIQEVDIENDITNKISTKCDNASSTSQANTITIGSAECNNAFLDRLINAGFDGDTILKAIKAESESVTKIGNITQDNNTNVKQACEQSSTANLDNSVKASQTFKALKELAQTATGPVTSNKVNINSCSELTTNISSCQYNNVDQCCNNSFNIEQSNNLNICPKSFGTTDINNIIQKNTNKQQKICLQGSTTKAKSDTSSLQDSTITEKITQKATNGLASCGGCAGSYCLCFMALIIGGGGASRLKKGKGSSPDTVKNVGGGMSNFINRNSRGIKLFLFCSFIAMVIGLIWHIVISIEEYDPNNEDVNKVCSGDYKNFEGKIKVCKEYDIDALKNDPPEVKCKDGSDGLEEKPIKDLINEVCCNEDANKIFDEKIKEQFPDSYLQKIGVRKRKCINTFKMAAESKELQEKANNKLACVSLEYNNGNDTYNINNPDTCKISKKDGKNLISTSNGKKIIPFNSCIQENQNKPGNCTLVVEGGDNIWSGSDETERSAAAKTKLEQEYIDTALERSKGISRRILLNNAAPIVKEWEKLGTDEFCDAVTNNTNPELKVEYEKWISNGSKACCIMNKPKDKDICIKQQLQNNYSCRSTPNENDPPPSKNSDFYCY